MKPIYLDYNATTPIDPAVREAMLPYLGEHFGNPSTTHAYGKAAKDAVEHARQQVAALIGAKPEEVIFTSGGSEGDNQAIIGIALANMDKGKHIITMCTEHPAVIETCRYLEKRLGFRVSYLPVDGFGLIDPDRVRRAVSKDTVLITIMHANNEVGTIEPIAEIGRIARERGIVFHTDAAQSCGKIPVDVNKLNVDLLTLAGHKLYAPKGTGALYIKRGTRIDPFIHGAGQEAGRRAGTENVPYIVGLGKACELAQQALADDGAPPAAIPAKAGIQAGKGGIDSLAKSENDTVKPHQIKALRDRLHLKIAEGLGQDRVHLNGHPEKRLPNTLNISIQGTCGDELLGRIPEIAASTGAACHAGSTEPSGVLVAMGINREWALGALRLTLGRWSSQQEIDAAASLIVERARAERQPAPEA